MGYRLPLIVRMSLAVILALGSACRDDNDGASGSEARQAEGKGAAGKAKKRKKRSGYWARPIPSQGPPPAEWPALQRSRLPKDCGTCHPSQFADWQTALHSKAMSPGLVGQILHENRDKFMRSCYACHAPMIEQQKRIEDDSGQWIENQEYDGKLREAGVACVVCHMRKSKIHGPQPVSGGERDMSKLPHEGFVVDERFQSSKFCAACHQFPKGWPELNGKLLENTYQEWKDSPAAKEGKTCQSCHMPDRRHTFRGIHDPEMTRSAFDFKSEVAVSTGGKLQASATLTNVGAGHMAPTYVPPRIEITFQQLDATGKVIGEPSEPTIIQRHVILGKNKREVFDTRLAPGKSISASWTVDRLPEATAVRAKVFCIPDQYYEELYKRLLKRYEKGGKPYQLITEALRHAESRRFTVFENDLSLPERHPR